MHQTEAMNALDSALGERPRAQVIMACGTGKTLVGRWYAQRIRAGVTVVVVPSLGLVAQTLTEWRSPAGWPFEALITCSDPSTADGARERDAGDGHDVAAPFWARLRARVTTSAGVVARRLVEHCGARPLVIFSTYHSVHVVAEALRSAGVVAELVVADEAHTLAGRPRREFRVVLTDELPARRRVFMTATHVAAAPQPGCPVTEAVSMDDVELFGPVAYRLDFADAIARGLLVDYRVLVYETPGRRSIPDPLAALATAAEHGVSSVLSFHGRVAKARAFAAAADGVVLADGRTVVARSVAGADPVKQREQALALLEAARPHELVVVSSARCLSAGIDIPTVDGVLFADPKHSDVDVIQSVGRALRTAAGKDAGLVMIPVCVPAGLDDDTVLSTGSFAAVWRILRGLRSMDQRLTAGLDVLQYKPSRRGVADGSRGPCVQFDISSLADPARFRARVVDFFSPAWDITLREVEAFAAEHGHVRMSRGTRLGEWCERQRRAQRAGMLLPERAERLSAMPGWAWDLAEQRWLEQWAQVLGVVQDGAGLDVADPGAAQRELRLSEPRSRVRTIGRWCARQRQLRRGGALDEWRRAKLAEIPGWDWNCIAEDDAQAVDLLGEYVAWKGDANPPADVVEDDVALGAWLNGARRRHATGRLSQVLLDELAVLTPSPGSPGALRWHTSATVWLLGLEALRQFVAREGHCRPSYSHYENLPDYCLPLYDWCARQRHSYRHGQLLSARARMLAQVPGWQWERRPAPRVLLDIGDTRHGTRAGYVKGCRCDACTQANRVSQAHRAAAAAAGGPSTDLVDAAAARAHLISLKGPGVNQKSLARACGLNVKTIAGVMCGDTRRILPDSESAICALTAADVRAAAAPGTQVDAAPTWELLDGMIARGWPKAWIARELGFGTSLRLSRIAVTAANADKVAKLAQRIGERVPPSRRARQPVPRLDAILAADTGHSAGINGEALAWAGSLPEQSYHISRVAQRSGLSVETVLAAGADVSRRDQRAAS
ncbi:DEAD/DEAH box helicase [Candidatus Mycobacterium methanotrophicum]|uniref:Helicase associated domain protein n=1 Tax=Candidatus Mycobacterium methanotrophicum TaxID=2943498 RepID=A0ABY4QRB6_9MYCO|nr:DEAD/DEAH box helicase [Candidatus Mycobacterium methanotrophicum]UQX13565.1 Helicase associated domain protein [Candidatus Mycobacterium methanotrophicum]